MNHRKDGTFRKGNKAARKPAARVSLAPQRVDPATLAILEARAAEFGGIGRVIDEAVKRLAPPR